MLRLWARGFGRLDRGGFFDLILKDVREESRGLDTVVCGERRESEKDREVSVVLIEIAFERFLVKTAPFCTFSSLTFES